MKRDTYQWKTAMLYTHRHVRYTLCWVILMAMEKIKTKKGVVVAGERGEILYEVVRKNLPEQVICG